MSIVITLSFVYWITFNVLSFTQSGRGGRQFAYSITRQFPYFIKFLRRKQSTESTIPKTDFNFIKLIPIQSDSTIITIIW